MIPQTVIDITRDTGQKIFGPLTRWTEEGFLSDKKEYIAAVNHTNDLIVFSRSDVYNWQAINVSALTGKKIVGGLTNWKRSRSRFLAGRNSTGDLIVFESSNGVFWNAENISENTGKKVYLVAASWLSRYSPIGDFNGQNIAALGNDNHLLVFSRRNLPRWQVVDVTTETGINLIGDLTAWVLPNGALEEGHIAGTTPNRSLAVFSRFPDKHWQSIIVDTVAGGGPSFVRPGPISWTISDLNIERVIVCGQNNRLYVYRLDPNTTNWLLEEDLTQTTGIEIANLGILYHVPDGDVTMLSARGIDGSLLQFWHTNYLGWQAYNVSQAMGTLWTPYTAAWTSNGNVENIASVITQDHHLILTSGFGTIHRLTDHSMRQFQLMKRQVARKKLLVILWDPHRPSDPAPSITAIDNLIFGHTNSVRHYFLENSRGRFNIVRTGVFGWFSASRPPDYWWGPPDTTDADGDGWVNPHVHKWAEAIRLADPQFNYKDYDKNPFDGNLRPDELGILIIIPQNSPFGTNRSVVGREFPNPEPLVVDGVTIGRIAEAYIGNPPNLGVVAHELTHLFLNHGDMYFTFFNPYAAGDYSLMDRTYKTTHLDPFSKLKFGWLRPQLIVRSGRYSLPSIETGHFIWILMDPRRSIDEYFIVENRWRGNSFDREMSDNGGLAIWHIMEDPVVFGSVPPPPGVSAEQWSNVSVGDGARRAIRMLRPLVSPPFDDAIALRDGADPITGFDVLSNDPNPQHSSLKWADGTPSWFAIKNISPAGELMTADISVPW
jgi:M6 family metalloprotease-like protein